ncbi:uncharacterized protein LAESUDRAFT_724225 [Laetiporus sulphureus 93-53]|uniref:Uncharacterized protein n=1 Tax=Laetiporus sulphureus 93-53 TaxID=1314785 RepID=A0A165F202_9APHY|nr:uncharacterized protein LAESUDRAFT_724225 [Laetiporus sulphureus 93-53]KZT08206.1 hypothetical protein LAESUDRAFT_724225 [Laetiporus sulphureus 93-53]
MSSDSLNVEHHIDKGKARARSPEPTEGTPLLGSSSSSYTARTIPQHAPPIRRLFHKVLTVFLISVSLCVFVLILAAVVLYSYRARAVSASPDEILQHALVLRGPDRVDVLNTTGDGGIWLMVHGRLGLDAGEVAGVNTADEDNFVQDAWKSFGRWGIHRLDRVTVNLSLIEITREGYPTDVITTLDLPPLEVPLTANPPPDNTWLTPVAVPVLIRPTRDAKVLLRFVRDSWRDGVIRVGASVGQASVQGGGLDAHDWRCRLRVVHSDIHTSVHIPIPNLPGLPPPGGSNPLPGFSDLVTLKSFVITSANDTLSIHAQATCINPIPDLFQFFAPSLPFIVSLPPFNATEPEPSPVEIATVYTAPFTLTHPNITISISGKVLPLPRNASTMVSNFLGNYVSARDSEIILETPLIPGLSVGTIFPAPRPKPHILRNVTIKDMKIKPVGSGMLASGTVFARVVLPRGIEVGVDVARVFPDVLVYDGEAPEGGWPQAANASEPSFRVLNYPVDDRDPDVPPTPPLPNPLPERAFAHIRPEDWLPALSEPADSEEGEGSAVAVSAKLVDVPLEVLPGREREFSNFVSKVVFGTGGALAGVQGVAAVAVHVQGLPFENGRDGEMELTGLPFQGSVRIGKRSLFDGSILN